MSEDRSDAGISIGGLNESKDDSAAAPTKKRKRSSTTKKRKRRKAVCDEGHEELTGAEMRAMFASTEDITLNVVHPSTWNEGERRPPKPTMRSRLADYLGYGAMLGRPCIADDGMLAPELLEVWKNNQAVAVGKPFPYKLRTKDEEEDEDNNEPPQDIEVARQQPNPSESILAKCRGYG